MDVDEAGLTVVLDPGSFTTRAGVAGDDTARFYGRTLDIHDHTTRFIRRGSVLDWDAAEAFYDAHVFGDAAQVVDDSDQLRGARVLVAESGIQPSKQRVRHVELMVERFAADSVCVASSGLLTLLASGRTSGVVLDCAHDEMRAVPVCEGLSLPHCTAQVGMGSGHVDERIREVLAHLDLSPLDVEAVKRECVEVTVEAAAVPEETRSFSLPDGRSVEIPQEVRTCADPLAVEAIRAVQGAIQSLHPSLHAEAYNNIVLGGTGSMLRSLHLCMGSELTAAAAAVGVPRVKVIAPPERPKSAWIGGSILGSLHPAGWPVFLTAAEYHELGESAVRRLCLL